MRLLLDTHLLLWAAEESPRLSFAAQEAILDTANTLHFSAASIWEIAVKHAKGRANFINPPELIRRGLLTSGFIELGILSEHVIVAGALPTIHRDPFDRLLLGQASFEELVLLTSDSTIARYPGAIKVV